MSAEVAIPDAPPVTQVAGASLVLVVVGGIVMASSFPSRPALGVPIALLCLSAILLVIAVLLLVRSPGFAWGTFFLVGRWALLAYTISAGMIEFSFLHNHASGAPLLVVTLMLVLFAINVPLLIAFTVARYQTG
ncbi:MAG TPA: hypothetical protein VN837_06415 [Chloroflexota bacterium]|nr:hypothetical protein [Chloroflexota bacterium]